MMIDSAGDDREADEDNRERLSGRDFYVKQAGRYSLLTAEEEAVLASRIRTGDRDAHDTLVRHNMRLALSFARKYSFFGSVLDFEDLMQAANMGLMAAAEKFDPTRGRFSTYAVWWIRQFIVREFNTHAKDVRRPPTILEWGKKMLRAQKQLAQQLKREPTSEELIAALHESTGEEVQAFVIADVMHGEVSFDAALGDEDDRSLYDTVQNASGHQSPEILMLARDEVKILINDVQRILEVLQASPRSGQWLRLFTARYNVYSSEGLECRDIPVPAGGSIKPSLQSMWRYLNAQGIAGSDSEFIARIIRAQQIESVIGVKPVYVLD